MVAVKLRVKLQALPHFGSSLKIRNQVKKKAKVRTKLSNLRNPKRLKRKKKQRLKLHSSNQK